LSEPTDFVFRLVKEHPEESAMRTLSRLQKVMLVLLVIGCVVWGALSFTLFLTVVNGVLMTFYIVLCSFKLYIIHLALGEEKEMAFAPEEVASLRDEELPLYSVLIPLYREAETLPRLVNGLKALDYPKEKLEVLFLLEEDDKETIDAAQRIELPGFVRPVIVPHSQPKTKPKACNLGLALARGKYLVIYDAEDRPEPDQLKKAVLGFRRCPPEIVCLQARLNYYNQRQNLLTRLFTIEYSTWFDLYLPGLDHVNAPIPLGGTSNHFDVQRLRELLGWDPFNVTEDCDLGVRIAKRKFGTKMINSTTWEEACSRLGFWVRQRSRWTKGYVQTYLVHCRHPLRLARNLGFSKSTAFHLIVGGTPLCLLINPIYWAMTVAWFLFRSEYIGQLFPFPIILWGLVCLFLGNFAFVYASALATYRRGYYDLVKHSLLTPFYWVIMSLGAWKGFLQLIYKPSYWEKTMHGFDLATKRS
jgi:cellulose synthase/poly-beta-1,6-N-acetylglucosamine synthase-like glycosyltransferase